MSDTEEIGSPSEQKDEETLKALEESLYIRLRRALEPRIDALLEARAEYFLPEYYDRVVTSEIRRLESAIEHNGRRIDELRAYMDQRFDDVERRFEEIDRRFEQVDKRLEQIDKRLDRIDDRLDRVEDRFDNLEARIDKINSTVRNWMIVGFAFLGVLLTVVQLYLSP